MTKRAPKSWRDVLPVHPEADLYPLLSKTDPAALKESGENIKKNGLQVPIVILYTGAPADRSDRTKYVLIDGRNRLDAMEAVGIRFKLIWKKGASDWNWLLVTTDIGLPDKGAVETVLHHENPAELVASYNLHRRMLTPDDRREKLVRLLKLHPEKSNRAISAETGVSEPTVRRSRNSPASSDAPAAKRLGRDGKAYRMPTPRSKPDPERPKTAIAAAASQAMPGDIGPLAIRKGTLGDAICARIANTSLEESLEMAALIELQRANEKKAEALIARAEAGKPVSAIAVIAAIKQAPAVTAEQLIEAWKHSRILRLWLQAGPDAQAALVAYQQEHSEVSALAAREAQARAVQNVGPGSAAEAERLRIDVEAKANEIQRLKKETIGLWSQLQHLLSAVMAACEREANWPPDPDQQQRRAKAMEDLRAVMSELLDLADSATGQPHDD